MRNKIEYIMLLSLVLFLTLESKAQVNKSQFNYLEYYTPDGLQYRNAFVWNTDVGNSARYYYDDGQWKKSSATLPINPLGDSPSQAGEIMLNCHEYYTPDNNQNRTVFIWNTKTGKTARYYYDNGGWKKSPVALPVNPLGDSPNQAGEIMLNYDEYYNPSGVQYRTVFIWNTKTGKSARYYYENKVWKKSPVALPANPLGNSSNQIGEIRMNYREYYNPKGVQYRVVFVWNTKTGKSARYYYEDRTWKKSPIALPNNPLGDSPSQVGEIMLNYDEYFNPKGQQYRTVFVWNTKTGKTARYYYKDGAWKKSSVALPSNPLGDSPSQAGEIMLNYCEYYTADGNQNRTVFIWNTKSGTTARYYFDNGNWKKSPVTLPSSPIE